MRDYGVLFLSNAGYFAALIFLPIYAETSLGATEGQVGLIVAGGSLAGFLSSFAFGRLADVRGRRVILVSGIALTSIAVALQVLASDPLSLGVSWFGFGFTNGMFPGALLAYAYEAGRPPGRFTSTGSLGWGAGTFLAGVVAALGSSEKWSFIFASVLFLLAFVLASGLRFEREVSLRVPLFPVAVIRRNWPAYAAILVRHTGANMIWVIFPLFLAQDLGMSKFEIGVLYTANAMTQFFVMLLAVDRFASTRLVFGGLALSSATFVTFTVARNFWEMLPTQIALGISWSFLFVGALKFVLERGVERATSSGLLASAIAISATIGPLIGGAIAEAFGRTTPMYVASAMAISALAVFATTLRRARMAGPIPAATGPR